MIYTNLEVEVMKLNESILLISAGTLAHLTGYSNYSQIDVIRNSLKGFVRNLSQDLIWQEAWFEYLTSNEWELCRKSIID
jgi:hypothetical protein